LVDPAEQHLLAPGPDEARPRPLVRPRSRGNVLHEGSTTTPHPAPS